MKLLEIDPVDVGHVAESLLAVTVARLALHVLRLETLAELSNPLAEAVPTVADPEAPPALPSGDVRTRLAWAVDAAGTTLGASCLPCSLGLLWMLARRGDRAHLCLGARREGDPLPAHAWVELDGRWVEGVPGGRRPELDFEVLCRLPRTAQGPVLRR